MNLVAPFAGIVARGDLSQSLGSPVERGEVLFEVAPLDDYRIIVEIDERDISMVSAGQTGKLTLAALPGESFELRVQRIIPVSTSEGGRNFFRAEANVESPPALLRPGMEGVAKVEVGRGTLLWIWTHNMTDWLRLWLWSKVF
jgi:multidrug efflux pump subunit AcrA (membrane-fusion protein)